MTGRDRKSGAERRLPVFRKLCAREQLELDREYPRLVPYLTALGLGADDALAVSHNATLLHKALETEPPLPSPRAVLEGYSLGEIAELCELYRAVEAGELEYGEREGVT